MTTKATETDFDAVVIGAGFGGIYALYKLRNDLGLRVRAFDRAGGVGGTWYWNQYPGALSDSEAPVYCYSFDEQLWQDTLHKNRYIAQPDVLAYLEHVVDRYDLRRDIQLNTGIVSAHFDEAAGVWRIGTDTGETITSRYLVTALGLLSATNVPDFPGRDSFGGELYHTGQLNSEHDFSGKRVGVIGTGSSGIQVATAIAPVVEHLTVFQRSPQYTVPIANRALTDEEYSNLQRSFEEIWDHVRNSTVGFAFEESTIPAMSVSEEERRRVFQEAWDAGGGFRFMFGTFCDIAVDPAANEAAASFVREKIAEIVEDPETARKLTPTDLYAKRPLCDSGYFAIFNRPNVSLVALKENGIVEITERGVRTADGVEHELDVLIFATGFDAVDGNYKRMDLRGRDGVLIKDRWADGPTSHLGMMTAGFPNLFMLLGPHSPFTNLPPAIETQVEWIADIIEAAEEGGTPQIEVSAAAEETWVSTCKMIADHTLFPKAESWIFGANIPGKPNRVMFFLAGMKGYREQLAEIAANGYEGFDLHSPDFAVQA